MRTISRNNGGAILLEVVLALALFVAAVAVVSSALNSSMSSLERQRGAMHAANLAATVHAELDLGLRSTESPGPEPFAEPEAQWTWELAQSEVGEPGDGESGLARIEVVIRNTNSAGVFRLAQTHKVVKTAIMATNAAPPMKEDP